MQGDIDNIAKSVMSSPQGLKIISGLDKFNTAMSTEQGRALVTMLGGAGGDALKSAAAASNGVKKDQGRALISSLLASKDGAALVAKVIEVIGL